MNRTGLFIALGLAVAAGLVFALAPALDLRAAALFYDAASGGFPLAHHPLAKWLREAVTWIVAAMAAPAIVALIAKLARPRTPMIIPGRAAIFLLVTLALGPGVLVNVVLKDYWGRPRPAHLVEFGGSDVFRPWWDPRGNCVRNCSFVSGEPSGAFWTMAWAALAPPHLRMLAYAGAIGFGAGVGVLRMAFGAHFLSDVIFAGLLVFLLIWAIHGVLYRVAGAPSEQVIEHSLSRLGDGLIRGAAGLWRQARTLAGSRGSGKTR